MKKLIALFLTAVMLVGTLPAFAAITEEGAEALPNSRVEVLTDLGIIDGYAAQAQVTTYGLRDVIKRIFGNDALMTKFYGDVYKDKAISLDDLLVVLLDALGYTDYANVKGGSYNAVSRYSAAKRIKLIEATANPNAKLTMELYVDLLYNALFEVEMYEASSISTSKSGEEFVRYEPGSTLGEVYLNLTKISGIVNGVCGIDIKTEIDSEDAIIIGNTKYKYEKVYPDQYIGRYVDAFVDKDTKVVKAVRVAEEENQVWVFHSEDVSQESTLSKFVYYNEKGKKKHIYLNSVDVVYNGKCFEKVTNTTLFQDDAVYTVIDNNGDNKGEVVLIDVYEVKRVNLFSKLSDALFITCSDSTYYDFKEFYEEGRYIEKADGTELKWDEIAKNDILLIRREILPGQALPDGGVTDMNRVIWSMEKVNGMVEHIEDKFESVTINGEEYALTDSLKNNVKKMSNLQTRDEVTCYMDAFGRIADMDIYSGAEKVAAVIGLDTEGDGLSRKIKIKCITEDNEIELLTFKNTVVLDGVTIDSEKLLAPNTYRAKLMSGDKVLEQLIKIKMNSKKEVISITTADGVTDDDFTVHGTMENSYYETWGVKNLNGKYIADAKTKIFTVWPDEDYFTNATETGKMEDRYTLYCVDEETNRVGYILNPYKTTEIQANQEVWGGSNNTYVVLGKGTTLDTRTEETVEYLLCWKKDRTVKLIAQDPNLIPTTHTSSSCVYLTANNSGSNYLWIYLKEQSGNKGWKGRKFYDLEPGTIISINTFDGYVNAFDICFAPDYVEEDLKNGTWNSLPFEAKNAYDKLNAYGISKTRFYYDLMYSYGEVQRMTPYGPIVNHHLPTNEELQAALPEGTTLTVEMAKDMMNGIGEQVFPIEDWDRLYCLDASLDIWYYDIENDKLTRGDFSNMRPGDRVFAIHMDANKLIFVYRLGE